MARWNDIRQLATLIEAESEGRLIDRELAIDLARRLARQHPHIEASMRLVVERLETDGRGAA